MNPQSRPEKGEPQKKVPRVGEEEKEEEEEMEVGAGAEAAAKEGEGGEAEDGAAGWASSAGQRQKEKRMMKKEKKRSAAPSVSVKPHGNVIKLKWVQAGLLFPLGVEKRNPKMNLCVEIAHMDKIRGVTCLLVEGLSPQLYEAKAHIFRDSLAPLLPPQRVRFPGQKNFLFHRVRSLLRTPVEPSSQAEATPWDGMTHAQKILSLVLPERVRLEHGYPVAGHAIAKGIDTSEYITLDKAATADVRVFAIDCEMCTTDRGTELTRVSVVNEEECTVYSTLVKPRGKVLDYHTQFSGITASALADVDTSLSDVQSALRALLPTNSILLGHSLENDLHALQLRHDRVIDTALIFGHMRGPPFKPSLKYLMKDHLKEDIQAGPQGHCSEEDSRACMQLLKLKLQREAGYGEYTATDESIFLRMQRSKLRGCMVAPPYILHEHSAYGIDAISCEDDRRCQVLAASDAVHNAKLSFFHFKDLERQYFSADAAERRDLDVLLQDVSEHVHGVLQQLPRHQLVYIIAAGTMKHVTDLQAKKAQLKKDWTESDEKELEDAVVDARDALLFVTVV